MTRIEIYSTAFCPYCVRAKMLLDKKGVEYTEYRVDKQRELMPEMIQRANGRTSVPQIFINDQHIGGFDDMAALDRSGKLDPLLNQE